jgi:hypothetical protein
MKYNSFKVYFLETSDKRVDIIIILREFIFDYITPF